MSDTKPDLDEFEAHSTHKDTDTDTDTDTTHRLARAGVLFLRVVQVTLALLALTFMVGAIIGGMNVLATAVIGIVALVLLGFAGVLELLAVGPIRRWAA